MDRKKDGAQHRVEEQELQDYLLQLDEIELEAARYFALSDEQFYWKPEPARWSAAQIFSHLSRFNRPYFVQIKAATDQARERGITGRGPFRHGHYARWLAGMMEPPGNLRMKTPRVFTPASEQPAREQTMESFTKDQIALRYLIENADGLHLAKVKVISPVSRLIRFSLGQCFRALIGHEKRHLLQINTLTTHPDFPQR